MNKLKYFLLILCGLSCVFAQAENVKEPLISKATFGMSYDIAFSPRVASFVGKGDKLSLKQLHRGSLEVMYPMYRYLMLGLSIDYTLVLSNKDNNPALNFSKEPGKIKSTFLGATARIRPQWPFVIGDFDLILYGEAQLGIGTSSPIAFGTEPLSEYEFKNTRNMPTPFPLMFETTPKIGVQLFGWRFIGIDAAFGYRMMWVVHPMVPVPEKQQVPNMPTDSRKAIWYDVTSPFIQVGIKFAL